MSHEISIHSDDVELLRRELRFVTQYFLGLGCTRCEVVFGWHWGIDYPAGSPWGTNLIQLADIESEIQKPEDAGHGAFGQDDIHILFPPLQCEFQFCHHSGIHLKFDSPGPISQDFLRRWSLSGLNPIEREITSDC